MALNSQEKVTRSPMTYRRLQSRRRLCKPGQIAEQYADEDYNIRHGRTYMYFKGGTTISFGYGLSYTSFRIQTPYQRHDAASERLNSRECRSQKRVHAP